MSNETKRDVFEYYLEMIKALKDPLAAETVREARQRYAAALPDDLPVIPKAQSDWIKQCKANDDSLSFALGDETTPIEVAKTFRVWGGYTDKNKDKWLKVQNTFATAWVLGVWRVEETGEIVKLEEEK
ncbi:DUF1642 domain-containing protein [Lacticaseibacillus paracasei subsp. paracasei]|nr:DUF1642 domain-containing protein [Lacticaseibacillus paracasei]MCD0433093.1 DUF1642 domain-containing protein [Lacticaseibacillus paracasei subsp. paracasei]